MRSLILVVAVSVMWPLGVEAQSAETGQSICYEVQRMANALVEYTETSCLPSAGKANALSFIVISDESVFEVEAAKKAWLLVVVASVGKALNEQPAVKVDELWVSDMNLMKSRQGHVLPASLARSLQRDIQDGKIDLEGMYSTIKKNLVERNLSK